MEHQILLVGAAALGIMITASVFARRTGVAAPLLLVVLGIAASLLPGAPSIHIEPEWILAGVLPPLLYASAVQLPVIDVRRNAGMIVWLAGVVVVASAVAIGFAVHWLFPSISLPLAIALGAVVSPTDAVAATAIGHRVGLPPRLMAILEGESLANDASALVVLRTAVAALAVTAGEFHLWHTVLDFAWAILGAALIGGLVGVASVLLRQRLDDPVLNTTISFAVPFFAFVPTESVEASGVLAAVVAGLVTGSLGPTRFSARDRQTQTTSWATINFILESALFLVMGYQLSELLDDARAETSSGEIAGLVVLVTGLLIVLRAVAMILPWLGSRQDREARAEQQRSRLDEFEGRIETLEPGDGRGPDRVEMARHRLAQGRADLEFELREPVTAKGLLVLAWAGMRGVVTVAAVQTIPLGTPHRDTVVLAAYLVALVTLILFGLTLPAVIGAMHFPDTDDATHRDAVGDLLSRIGAEAIEALGPLEEQRIDGEPLDPAVVASLREQVLPRLVAGQQQARSAAPGAVEQSMVIQQRYLAAMRDALDTERRIGVYSTDTYRSVQGLLDMFEGRTGRNQTR